MSTILIIGCSRGLGLAFVQILANEPQVGVVFATSRSPQPSEELAAIIQTSNCEVRFIQLDPRNTQSVTTAVEQTTKYLESRPAQGRGMDILISNAASTVNEPEGARGMHGL